MNSPKTKLGIMVLMISRLAPMKLYRNILRSKFIAGRKHFQAVCPTKSSDARQRTKTPSVILQRRCALLRYQLLDIAINIILYPQNPWSYNTTKTHRLSTNRSQLHYICAIVFLSFKLFFLSKKNTIHVCLK